MKNTKRFKAIAKMADYTHEWTVVIGHYDEFIDAERDARRFAHRYDDCLYVQVLDA